MAKKIVDENGNTDVQKKPFYKRGWFWTLAIIKQLLQLRLTTRHSKLVTLSRQMALL